MVVPVSDSSSLLVEKSTSPSVTATQDWVYIPVDYDAAAMPDGAPDGWSSTDAQATHLDGLLEGEGAEGRDPGAMVPGVKAITSSVIELKSGTLDTAVAAKPTRGEPQLHGSSLHSLTPLLC
jgi:hypothetical protein